jgi:hypothetical protein
MAEFSSRYQTRRRNRRRGRRSLPIAGKMKMVEGMPHYIKAVFHWDGTFLISDSLCNAGEEGEKETRSETRSTNAVPVLETSHLQVTAGLPKGFQVFPP